MGILVSPETFQQMMKLDVSEHTQEFHGYEYLSIYYARMLMLIHFPQFEVEVLTSDSGLPFVDIEDSDRGTLIRTRIRDTASGACSETFYYPVMVNQKGSVKPAAINADSREINDQLQRAIVKTIAIVTGIGFDLFLGAGEEGLAALAESKVTSNKPPKEEKPARSRSTQRTSTDEELDDEYYAGEEDDIEEDEELEEEEEEEDAPPPRRSRLSSPKSSGKPPAAAGRSRRLGGRR